MRSALSVTVLYALPDNLDPWVPALLVDRKPRSGKCGIGEGPDGHGNGVCVRARAIPHRRAALRAEMVLDPFAAVGGAHPFAGFAGNFHLILGIADLSRERRAAALLASKAMADRNTHRFAAAGDDKLAALTGCGAGVSHRGLSGPSEG